MKIACMLLSTQTAMSRFYIFFINNCLKSYLTLSIISVQKVPISCKSRSVCQQTGFRNDILL